MTELLRRCWQALRAISGDDAYERYLTHHCAQHAADAPPLSRADFFRAEQQRKWSGVKRCC
ncbi:MAG TPA: YbdD/YjiX family protein [Gammaproteobacteria bacterium]|nr:YbdD/YjiX family protein [Gammaproteobacteria bacterium]